MNPTQATGSAEGGVDRLVRGRFFKPNPDFCRLHEAKGLEGVIVIENLFNSGAYRSYLGQRGYLLWQRVYPNDIFVHGDLMPGLADRLAAWCYGLTLPLRR